GAEPRSLFAAPLSLISPAAQEYTSVADFSPNRTGGTMSIEPHQPGGCPMCDTVVALGSATADGAVIFGKNSDREPNEAHHLLLVPRARHEPGSTVKCTYVEIPQVDETYAVLLSKPFWMWGAEMGA